VEEREREKERGREREGGRKREGPSRNETEKMRPFQYKSRATKIMSNQLNSM
jgi:hypothetical protein